MSWNEVSVVGVKREMMTNFDWYLMVDSTTCSHAKQKLVTTKWQKSLKWKKKPNYNNNNTELLLSLNVMLISPQNLKLVK